MADKKISELVELAEEPNDNDMIPLVDESVMETKFMALYYLKNLYVRKDIITAANDFILGLSSGNVIKKTLAETQTILGLPSAYGNQLIVLKTADETVNNSTTPQADDALIIPVAASKTYAFRMMLFLSCTSAAADFKFSFTYPTSCTMKWQGMLESVAVASAPAAGLDQTGTLTQGGAASGFHVLHIEGVIINSTNAGSVTLNWAQNTATVADSKVLAGSYIQYQRLN